MAKDSLLSSSQAPVLLKKSKDKIKIILLRTFFWFIYEIKEIYQILFYLDLVKN